MSIPTYKPNEISVLLVDHFQKILKNYEGSNREAQSKLLEVIPKLILAKDNKELNKPITLEEVRTVVFNMNPDKSLGPNGFGVFFIKNVGISLV